MRISLINRLFAIERRASLR